MTDGEINQLADTVRQTAFEIHKFHRHGHLEKIYENALVHRLRKLGLHVEQQFPITVFDDDGTVLGDYFVDLLVERQLVVEIKAADCIANAHIAQVLGYLRSSRFEHGLLINFGAERFQIRKLKLDAI